MGKGCILAGRKLGNAVVRNRVKRRVRAVTREMRLWRRAWEIAFCPRPGARDATYKQLEEDVLDLLDRAGIRARVDDKDTNNAD